jgi:hypothetical protein
MKDKIIVSYLELVNLTMSAIKDSVSRGKSQEAKDLAEIGSDLMYSMPYTLERIGFLSEKQADLIRDRLVEIDRVVDELCEKDEVPSLDDEVDTGRWGT